MIRKTLLGAALAATGLALGSLAFAQANPPTSTAGAGCTATANAMRGGNLGGTPSTTACTTSANTAASANAAADTAAVPAGSAGMGASAADSGTAVSANTGARMRPARADRG